MRLTKECVCFLLIVATCLAQNEIFLTNVVQPPIDCNKGFKFVENRGCVDVDECVETKPCKSDQTCRNLWGSYKCYCQPGFTLDEQTGECVDKDECSMQMCGSGQKCINHVGSFSCVCPPGSTKIGRFCRDINECVQRPCDENQYCINTRGSYRCRCRRGYTADGMGKCTDTDECIQGMCQGLGEQCQNTVGGYQCVCKEGFSKDALTQGRYCVDVNECDLNPCPQHSECINSHGSYHCRCHKGFTQLDGSCVDDQECQLGEGRKCQWRCQNVPGSFVCKCPAGYNRVDFACNDINECDVYGKETCGDHQTCVNTHGSYKCIDALQCANGEYYRKLMTTDEFSYRQITTNICRRKRCRTIARNDTSLFYCRDLPLSVSHHYIDITSRLAVPTNLFRIYFPARRRRQIYHFSIVNGTQPFFSLRQPADYLPHAFLILEKSINGPAEHVVNVDISTYNKRMEMRDNRLLTVHIIVSPYDF